MQSVSEMDKRRVKLEIIPSRKLYLILTVKGLDFVNEWYKSNRHIPSNLTKLYQLLLRTARLNGVINMWVALRLGYSREVINRAISKAYLKLSPSPIRPSDETIRRIKEVFSKPPREIYV